MIIKQSIDFSAGYIIHTKLSFKSINACNTEKAPNNIESSLNITGLMSTPQQIYNCSTTTVFPVSKICFSQL